MALHNAVPDAKKLWLFPEQLTGAGATERLFIRFDAIRASGAIWRWAGRSSATVIEARRPRLNRGEKQINKDGGIPAGWSLLVPRFSGLSRR